MAKSREDDRLKQVTELKRKYVKCKNELASKTEELEHVQAAGFEGRRSYVG